MTVKKVNRTTPLQQLLSEKWELRKQCQRTEQKIKEDFQYISSNAGRLLITQMTTLLLPTKKGKAESSDGHGLSYPWMKLAWQIARPIAYRWMGEMGWQVFKSMFRKKK